MGSDISIPVLRNNTQELQDTVGLQLPEIIAQSTPELQFLECLKGRYHKDSFFRQIVQEPSQFQNFHIENGLIFYWESEKYILCILRILINNRNTREIIIEYVHSILAHLEPWKTLAYLREQVWWKDMITDINSYCNSCHTCKISKPNN